MNKYQDLYEFVDRAVKSRKYPDATGVSLKVALKLFEVELTDEEKASVTLVRKNIDQIYQSVFSKNKTHAAGSLATYKSRVLKVLGDFEKYGVDPTKMTSWVPKLISRAKKQPAVDRDEKRPSQQLSNTVDDGSFHVFDFAGGLKLLVPKTTRTMEAIMDGELKQIKTELKTFADTYCAQMEESAE